MRPFHRIQLAASRRDPWNIRRDRFIFCLLLAVCLPRVSSSADIATVVVNNFSYEADQHWPRERHQFNWGVEDGAELDLSQSATGVGVDNKTDRVYALVRTVPHVRIYNTEGLLLNSWSPKQIGRVHHLHVDKTGHVWIADNHGHTVTKYTPQGEAVLNLGTFDEEGMDARHFNQPTDVATTADGRFVFVADGYVNKRIAKFDGEGNYLGMWGGREAGMADGEFILPHSLAVKGNRVYVADREAARIQVFDLDGNFLEDWRDIIIPWAVESVGDYILVGGERLPAAKDSAAIARERIKGGYLDPPLRQDVLVFNQAGDLLGEIPLPLGNEYGQVNWLHAIALDDEANLYVTDVVGNHVQKWKPVRDAEK